MGCNCGKPSMSNFQQVKPINSRRVIRENRMPTEPMLMPHDSPGELTHFKFRHGLGDCSLFAHAVKLWTDKGFPIGIDCSPDKEPLFKAAGATIVRSHLIHEYPHPPRHTTDEYDWDQNKLAFNLKTPLPFIGEPYEIWEELLNVNLSLDKFISHRDSHAIDGLLHNFPNPIVIHSRGNTGPYEKNLTPKQEQDLYKNLLDHTDANILLLDFDNRVEKLSHPRVKHLLDDFRNLTLMELAYLLNRSRLFIGVDSGPLHFTSFTNCPALGLWSGHYPSYFALPRAKTAHIVSQDHQPHKRNIQKRHGFNLIQGPLTGKFITDQINKGLIGSDLFLESLVEKTDTSERREPFRNRSKTLSAAFSLLRSIQNPTIVETGCIRSPEDWTAGYSTYLFGIFAKAHKGTVHSVDLDINNCNFAKDKCQCMPVTIHQDNSLNFLRDFQGKADLVYLDSLDTNEPRAAEHNLNECKLALNIVKDTGMILIDDSYNQKGKGELSIPFLISQGWKVHESSLHQILLTRKPCQIT